MGDARRQRRKLTPRNFHRSGARAPPPSYIKFTIVWKAAMAVSVTGSDDWFGPAADASVDSGSPHSEGDQKVPTPVHFDAIDPMKHCWRASIAA